MQQSDLVSSSASSLRTSYLKRHQDRVEELVVLLENVMILLGYPRDRMPELLQGLRARLTQEWEAESRRIKNQLSSLFQYVSPVDRLSWWWSDVSKCE